MTPPAKRGLALITLLIALYIGFVFLKANEAFAEEERTSEWIGRSIRDGFGGFFSGVVGNSKPSRADDPIAREAAEIRNWELTFLAHFVERANVPRYCGDKTIDQMPDECFDSIGEVIKAAEHEMIQLRVDFDEERRKRGLIP